MTLNCRDLVQYGVELVPPSQARYFDLLADIEQRLHNPPQGTLPPGFAPNPEVLKVLAEHDTTSSAILVNRSDRALVTFAYSRWGRDSPGLCEAAGGGPVPWLGPCDVCL